MPLPTFLEKLFGRAEASKDAAKSRLKLVLMHDRASIPAAVLEQMRSEMLVVLSKYVEIDQQALEVNLERSEGTIALLANVPILRVRTDSPLPAAEASAGPAKVDSTTAKAAASADASAGDSPDSDSKSSEPALA